MTRLDRLQQHVSDTGRPVRVALVGAGQMGRGLAAQVGRIPGLDLAVAVDVDPGRASDALVAAGHAAPETDADAAPAALEAGRGVALTRLEALPELDVDVVV